MKLIFRMVVFVLTSLAVFAQSDANKGQISGTVFDQRQAVIPNAKVSVNNTSNGRLA